MTCPFCHTVNDDASEMCFKCGHGLVGLTEGMILDGRYEILKPLGRGGMGIVYQAHDRDLDELVALKVLRPEVASSADVARRFRSEIKLARKVRHPNVCAIHEYGQEGHLRYIVMEYVEGTDLKRIIKAGGPLAPEDAYPMAIQIAEGLEAIHKVGIVHRDLKTQNIMRDPAGLVRLMDFGIAKQFGADAATGATRTGQVIGTPEYMSPEQARAQEVDARSDIYALGIVIYELFTGDVPFRGDTPVATMLKQLQEPLTLDTPQAAMLPAPVGAVLKKALAKDPADRFASARETIEALVAARAASSPPKRPSGPRPLAQAPRPPIVTARVREAPTEQIGTPPPMRAPTRRPALSTPASTAAPTRRTPRLVLAAVVVAGVAAVGIRAMRGIDGAPSAATTLSSPPTALPAISSPGESAPPPEVSPTPRTGGTPEPAAPQTAPTTIPALAATVSARLPVAADPARVPRSDRRRPTTPQPTPALRAAERASSAPEPDKAPSIPSATTVAMADGTLRLRIRPWADVTIDGRPLGPTPMGPISLSPGTHLLILSNPAYKPLHKQVEIRAGEVTELNTDLKVEALPK